MKLADQEQPIATRPTPGRETAATHAHEARAADPRRPARASQLRPACRRARASLSPSPALESDKPAVLPPPTVSSSLRSSSRRPPPPDRPPPRARHHAKGSPGAPSTRSSPITPKRSRAAARELAAADHAKRSPRSDRALPITQAMDRAKAKPSTSRWSVASPRQLMQKASNAFKVGSPQQEEQDLAGPAEAVASVREVHGASGEINTGRRDPLRAGAAVPPSTAPTPLNVQAEVVVEQRCPTDDRGNQGIIGAGDVAGGSSGGVDTVTKAGTSWSEPVTPAKEAVNKGKAAIDTILGAGANDAVERGRQEGSGVVDVEDSRGGSAELQGSRVKTAMEKRPEAQPKKKERCHGATTCWRPEQAAGRRRAR
ncbi:hypothetical protein ZWY2020_001658 [Hordeum vulgare]|nr:hypothetical protein ZWY2020_001658 [Hordeum vulgare]